MGLVDKRSALLEVVADNIEHMTIMGETFGNEWKLHAPVGL